ncbi:hypothetical protein ACPOL_6900 (plasmid) [Acidisarcina polymorpha]|uniref:Uncharacterized protein n=1 Tax=Acidisarcina polymorpha TaxID=2211140 RepID=A0A2Z5GAU1_9BACT|nr:hypothetical protein ACPOL_6900 [Acidisarcina polymorpha]
MMRTTTPSNYVTLRELLATPPSSRLYGNLASRLNDIH